MARTPHGILGALQGKIGPVTGYIRNGKAVLRIAHSRPDGKITPARTAQREKIKLCNSFTKAFTGTGFFNRTFPSKEPRFFAMFRKVSRSEDKAGLRPANINKCPTP